MSDTIAAIATGAISGPVGIIRLSGPQSLAVAGAIFTPAGRVKVAEFEPYRMYPGHIECGQLRDFGLCVCFKAPRSFTGEDVVELHCHGGAEVPAAVLSAALSHGARMAGAGEFTRRAFLNGKLSLASAEGMAAMISASSSAEARAGASLYAEKLTSRILGLQARLKEVLAGIAADIDYPEEDIAATDLADVGARLGAVRDEVSALAAGYGRGAKIKSGVRVALCGAPNVGKSSLLNALLGYDRAIVSPRAGTTRDIVEGSLEIDGVNYLLTDTAGLRESDDEIESIGISMARRAVASADLVLYVCEGDYTPLEGVADDDPRLIKIYNKCDISPARPQKFDIYVSAETGENLPALRALMSERAMGGSVGGGLITERRHYEALVRAQSSLAAAIDGIGVYPLDLISIDITSAWSALGEITGETASEEIIEEVFSKFCVGK